MVNRPIDLDLVIVICAKFLYFSILQFIIEMGHKT